MHYNPNTLCRVINSGRLRLPLSHCRALELVAVLEGTQTWHALAHRPDALTLKARASVLRFVVNQRFAAGPITAAAAAEALNLLPAGGGAMTRRVSG